MTREQHQHPCANLKDKQGDGVFKTKLHKEQTYKEVQTYKKVSISTVNTCECEIWLCILYLMSFAIF